MKKSDLKRIVKKVSLQEQPYMQGLYCVPPPYYFSDGGGTCTCRPMSNAELANPPMGTTGSYDNLTDCQTGTCCDPNVTAPTMGWNPNQSFEASNDFRHEEGPSSIQGFGGPQSLERPANASAPRITEADLARLVRRVFNG